jgi:hypothetical protein
MSWYHGTIEFCASPSSQGRADPRSVAEVVVGLAGYLEASDRELIRGVYHHGMSMQALARAIRRHPRSLQLRLRRLVARLGSEPFRFVASQGRLWPEPRRRVADAIYLKGQTQRQAAAGLGMSLHAVRREVLCIQFALSEHRRASRSAEASHD